MLEAQSNATVTAGSLKRNVDKRTKLSGVESIKVYTSYVSESNIAAVKKIKSLSPDSIARPVELRQKLILISLNFVLFVVKMHVKTK